VIGLRVQTASATTGSRSKRNLHTARSEPFDLLAPYVQIIRSANRLEYAGDDEIEHLASIDAEQGSRIRPAHERGGGSHAENVFDGLPRRAAQVQAMKEQRPAW
jgi:hypothetical protein